MQMELEKLIQKSPQKEYSRALFSYAEKLLYWKSNGFKDRLPNLGMIKTILFSYQKDGQERYILASTLGQSKIDLEELQLKLGLSAAEGDTLDHYLDDTTIERITGRKRGAVSPFAADLTRVDSIYFSRELIQDMKENPGKEYDVPLSLTSAVFLPSAQLYAFLKQNPAYALPAETKENEEIGTEKVIFLDTELDITEWKVKEIDPSKAGYSYLFAGTRVSFQGQEYEIKNPRMKKEGIYRRRKETGCVALPFTRENGKIEYKMTERGRKRIVLSLSYEILEDLYREQHRDIFQMRDRTR